MSSSRPRLRIVARVPWRSTRLSPFVVGSVLVHIVGLGAFVLFPTLAASPRMPEDAIVVDLVAAAPDVPAAPVRAPVASPPPPPPPPPPDAPPPPPEGNRVATQVPPPSVREPNRRTPPESVPEEIPQPAPRQTTPGPPRDALPPPAGPPGPPAGAEEISGVTALEASDVEFAWYRDSVTAALYSNWRKPVLDRVEGPREVSVTFDILRDGGVRNLRVDQSSGVPSLDRSALRAVADATPFPALPSRWSEPQLAARFLFRLYPE